MPEEAKSDHLKPDVEIHELPEDTQIVAPMEGNVSLEYIKDDIQEDGSLKKGRFVFKSRDGSGNTINLTLEPTNFRLLVEPSTPTITSEGGVVKYSHEIILRKGEPFAAIKNPHAEMTINTSSVSNPRI